MPMTYAPPTGGTRKIEFWLRSAKGTSGSKFVMLPMDWTEDEIKSELQEWCSQFGCWGMSDSYIRYGFNEEKDFGSRK